MLDEIAETTSLAASQRPAPVETDRLLVSVTIDIIGPFTTTMVVRVEVGDAIQLAAAMLGEPFAAIDQQTADETMGEVVNVLAGGVKSLIDDETHLGIPSTTHLVGVLGELQHSEVVNHELGRFEVGFVDSEV